MQYMKHMQYNQNLITHAPQRTSWMLPIVDYHWAKAVLSTPHKKEKSAGCSFRQQILNYALSTK